MNTPHWQNDHVTVWHGDALALLRADENGYDYDLGYGTRRLFPDASIDAVVTDPPYGLGFMGQKWDTYANEAGRRPSTKDHKFDHVGGNHNPSNAADAARTRRVEAKRFGEWCELWAAECLRVLKPGGHMLAFGGSRTWHRLAAGIEDAGFEIRDSIAWLYGSGFPKSLDVSKAIDKLDAVDERLTRAREFQTWLAPLMTPKRINELTGTDMGHHLTTHPTQPAVATADLFDMLRHELPPVPERIEHLVAQRTVESKNFAAREVTGTRRMVDTTKSRLGFAGSTYGGTGETCEVDETAAHTLEAKAWEGWGTALKPAFEPVVVARKPLAGTVAGNVLAYGTGALNIDASRIGDEERVNPSGFIASGSGNYIGGPRDRHQPDKTVSGRWPANVVLDESQAAELDRQSGTLTSGGGNKAPKVSSWFTSNDVQHEDTRVSDSGGASRFFPMFRYEAKAPTSERPKAGEVQHPTVKPLDLMRWLVRLVTPPGGVILEPFAGSGTTVEAAVLEGFHCIAIEREADYLQLIEQRLSKPMQQSLFGDWDDDGDAA